MLHDTSKSRSVCCDAPIELHGGLTAMCYITCTKCGKQTTTKPKSKQDWEEKLEQKFPQFDADEDFKGILIDFISSIIKKVCKEEQVRIVNALREEYGGDFLNEGIRVGRVLHKLNILYPKK